MIVAKGKPLEDIIAAVQDAQSILVAGCNECVTVCEAGGSKEVGVLAAALRLHFQNQGRKVQVGEITLQRQCDREYVSQAREEVEPYALVISLACGVGCQFMAEEYTTLPVLPGVDTLFMGGALERGVWSERCQGCGNCLLGLTGGVCPVSRCAKRLLNGPCGGSTAGKCEIGKEVDCAWHLIIERMKALGRLEDYEKIIPLKDWSTDRAGGPRKVVKEEVRL
ncbi:MAG: methylenetetrahydrofolate reductase C-terminal domain-containing protein [Thermodesulfobacteriota bacterium]